MLQSTLILIIFCSLPDARSQAGSSTLAEILITYGKNTWHQLPWGSLLLSVIWPSSTASGGLRRATCLPSSGSSRAGGSVLLQGSCRPRENSRFS